MNTEPTVPLDPPAPGDAPAPDDMTARLDAPPPAAAAPVPATECPAVPAAPRVRWAGIVWGSVFALVAIAALWTLAEASRLAGIRDWLLTLSPAELHPGWVIGIVVLAGGLLLLILGGVALLRNLQLRNARRAGIVEG